MQQEEASGVVGAFQLDTQAFQALDARAVARHFHEPAFITPKDVRALPTTAAVQQTYARGMADIPPDYTRREFGPIIVDFRSLTGDWLWIIHWRLSIENAQHAAFPGLQSTIIDQQPSIQSPIKDPISPMLHQGTRGFSSSCQSDPHVRTRTPRRRAPH